MEGRKCLVTGGAGFIGSHLAQALLQQGAQVKILDNFSTGKRENLEEFAHEIEILEGCITDGAALARALEGVEIVFHQAAMVSVPESIKRPIEANEINVEGTLQLLDRCCHAGVKRFIFASSSAVYGDSKEEAKKEDHLPRPISPYGVQKLASEHYCSTYHKTYGLSTVALRYFNVFGPRQDLHSEYAAVIPKFIDRLFQDKPPIIYGDGTQSRDFVYVKDVVQANLLAAQVREEGWGNVYNVASGKETTLLELAEILNRIFESDHQPEHEPPRPGDIKHSTADINLCRDKLGFFPQYSLPEALMRTVDWFRRQS